MPFDYSSPLQRLPSPTSRPSTTRARQRHQAQQHLTDPYQLVSDEDMFSGVDDAVAVSQTIGRQQVVFFPPAVVALVGGSGGGDDDGGRDGGGSSSPVLHRPAAPTHHLTHRTAHPPAPSPSAPPPAAHQSVPAAFPAPSPSAPPPYSTAASYSDSPFFSPYLMQEGDQEGRGGGYPTEGRGGGYPPAGVYPSAGSGGGVEGGFEPRFQSQQLPWELESAADSPASRSAFHGGGSSSSSLLMHAEGGSSFGRKEGVVAAEADRGLSSADDVSSSSLVSRRDLPTTAEGPSSYPAAGLGDLDSEPSAGSRLAYGGPGGEDWGDGETEVLQGGEEEDGAEEDEGSPSFSKVSFAVSPDAAQPSPAGPHKAPHHHPYGVDDDSAHDSDNGGGGSAFVRPPGYSSIRREGSEASFAHLTAAGEGGGDDDDTEAGGESEHGPPPGLLGRGSTAVSFKFSTHAQAAKLDDAGGDEYGDEYEDDEGSQDAVWTVGSEEEEAEEDAGLIRHDRPSGGEAALPGLGGSTGGGQVAVKTSGLDYTVVKSALVGFLGFIRVYPGGVAVKTSGIDYTVVESALVGL